jgi:superfamily 6 holin (LLH)
MFEIPVEVQSVLFDLLVLLVVKVIAPLAFLLLTMMIVKANSWLKAKLSQEQLMFAKMIAKTAVQAAQQSGLAGIIKNEAADKKKFAIEYLSRELAKFGLKHLAEQADDLGVLIESEINQGAHKLPDFILATSDSDLKAVTA